MPNLGAKVSITSRQDNFCPAIVKSVSLMFLLKSILSRVLKWTLELKGTLKSKEVNSVKDVKAMEVNWFSAKVRTDSCGFSGNTILVSSFPSAYKFFKFSWADKSKLVS